MNYCNLAKTLDMKPLEVFNLLRESKAPYYNLNSRKWESVLTGDLTLVVQPFEGEKFPSTDPVDWFDQYVTEATLLSWEKLYDYLQSDFIVSTLEQAAFLVDLADKNCIEPCSALFSNIVKHRTTNTTMWLSETIRPNYNFKEMIKNCNRPVLEALNLVVSETSFMRI